MFKFHAMRSISATLFIALLAISHPAISKPLSNQMDIRVLIDVSGSMKKTDPNNLRIPALQVLTQLLPKGSKAGVWQFANTPKVVVPHGEVDAQWQQQAALASQKISSTGLYTDIGAALTAASFNAQDQTQARQLHVILLTDGMVDVSKDAAQNALARNALLEPILQQYINVGARVHTVGLSYRADQATLSAIARRTDGLFEVAEDADQLLDIFLRALDNTVVTQQVAVEPIEQSFLVEQGIESMTVVVEKNGDENIKFTDGKQDIVTRIPAIDTQIWQSSSTHEVVTIQGPTPGTWTLISDTAILKRINVVGKIQILLQQSHQNIKVGQRSYIDVQLANAKGELLSAAQLQGFKLEVAMDNGDKEVFARKQRFAVDKKTRMDLPVLNQPGMYNLNIAVINGSLVRTINRSLKVHPLVALTDTQRDAANNALNMPVANEVAVIVDTAPKKSQPILIEVSKEKPSKELQALMFESQVEQEATAVVNEPAAVIKEADTAPKTITGQIVDAVNELTAKLSSPAQALETLPNQTSSDTVNEAAISVQDDQIVTNQSMHWRWYIVGGAAFVLLILLVILRRTNKIPEAKTQTKT
tara:strand:+ start:1790 stop:3556 length:1767 start_codon:yes stop_codon:yes gene_type:complete